MSDEKCRCPVGLPDGAVEELMALHRMFGGDPICPIHDKREGSA